MGNKIFTVAIIGTGGRGGYVYGTLIHNLPDKFKIVALCDIKPQKLNFFAERFGVSEENLFTDEKIFFEKKCFFLCTYPYCGLTLRINNLFKEII